MPDVCVFVCGWERERERERVPSADWSRGHALELRQSQPWQLMEQLLLLQFSLFYYHWLRFALHIDQATSSRWAGWVNTTLSAPPLSLLPLRNAFVGYLIDSLPILPAVKDCLAWYGWPTLPRFCCESGGIVIAHPFRSSVCEEFMILLNLYIDFSVSYVEWFAGVDSYTKANRIHWCWSL